MRRLTPMKVSSELWKIYRRPHKIVCGMLAGFFDCSASRDFGRRLRAVDVGNAEHHDFELHVDRFDSLELD